MANEVLFPFIQCIANERIIMKISKELLSEAEALAAQIKATSQEAADYRSGCIVFGCGMGSD